MGFLKLQGLTFFPMKNNYYSTGKKSYFYCSIWRMWSLKRPKGVISLIFFGQIFYFFKIQNSLSLAPLKNKNSKKNFFFEIFSTHRGAQSWGFGEKLNFCFFKIFAKMNDFFSKIRALLLL